MSQETCKNYIPWNEADPYPLSTRECLDYDSRHGANFCVSELSEHEGKKCPWAGYPMRKSEGTGEWQLKEVL